MSLYKLAKNGKLWYKALGDGLGERADKLFVILFDDSCAGELMICNFDVRGAIPFNSGVSVITFREFMELPFDGKNHYSYSEVRTKAEELRQKNIEDNYHTGARV